MKPAGGPAGRPAASGSDLRNALFTFSTNFGVAVLSLASVLIVSRALGPAGRGSVALLTTIAVMSQYAVALGIQEANVNIGSATPAARSALATNSVLLALLFGGSAAVALGGIASVWPRVAGHLPPSLLWLALGSIPIQLVGTYLLRLVQADYRFAAGNVAWLVAPLVTVVGNVGLFACGRLSVRSALLSWIAGQVLGTLLLLRTTSRMCGFGRPSLPLARAAVGFGLKIHPATLMSFTNYRFDQWLLGALAPRRELGLYSIAVSWAEVLFFLPTAVSLAQRPGLVRDANDDATARTTRGVRLAVLLTLPLVLAMMAAAPLLCIGFFGGRFAGSVPELRILALGAFGILALKQLGSALTARRRPLLQTAATAVAFVVTVALDLLLIPRHGGLGAAIASTLAYSAGGIAIVFLFLRTTRDRPRQLLPGRADLRLLAAGAGRLTTLLLRAVTPAGGGSIAPRTGGPGG